MYTLVYIYVPMIVCVTVQPYADSSEAAWRSSGQQECRFTSWEATYKDQDR